MVEYNLFIMQVKILDFYADWCGPCDKQDPILEDVEDNWEDEDDLSVQKVDIDEEEQLAQQFSVRSIPTIIVVFEDENGDYDIHERFVGVTSEDDINDSVDQALSEL